MSHSLEMSGVLLLLIAGSTLVKMTIKQMAAEGCCEVCFIHTDIKIFSHDIIFSIT